MSDKSPTKFELWKLASGYALFAENNEQARRLLEPDARLAWTVEAASWSEARRKMCALMNREPSRAVD